jgi:predicted DsbA family dithiol-disulfide isomerase
MAMDDDSSYRVAGDRDSSDRLAKESRLSAATSVGIRIDIASEAICPWCYVGKRHLDHALATLAEEGLTFQVHWNPFQLNPEMPMEGRDRASYRTWKFGSALKAAALDKKITEAAANIGLGFRTDLMTRTPNTFDVHRMIWLAGQHGSQDAVVEATFRAYFIEGRDIGEHGVLGECAAEAGLPRQAVIEFLVGDFGREEVRTADRAAREAGVSGVPSFFSMDTACSLALCRRTLSRTPCGGAGKFCCSNRLGISVNVWVLKAFSVSVCNLVKSAKAASHLAFALALTSASLSSSLAAGRRFG